MGERAPLEGLRGFGRAQGGVSRVWRPRTADELASRLREAAERERTLALRGAGRSYGDAALNDGGAVLDLSGLRRVLDWDPGSGVIEVEPGATIEDLWRRALPDGWWPAVVPGTMRATVGGCVAMNVHGKNCFRTGPTGEHVEELELILPTGERRTCGPRADAELFRGVVAGAGLLGCIARVRLRLKRVHSGDLRVTVLPAGSLREMAEVFEAHAGDADYLVGWCDALAPGAALGRGVVHRADYLAEGEDPAPAETLRAEHQDLPERFLGLVPRGWLPPLMRLAGLPLVWRAVCAAKYRKHVFERGHRSLQSHVAFAFLLDHVPGWERAYGPAGLIQIQPFVPRARAVGAFEEILRLARRRGLPPYLVVFKKHRPDPFLLTHGLDGYSLAMDFSARRRRELWALAREIHEIAISAGGRFYFAKDSALEAGQVRRMLPADNLRAFAELKRKCDPAGLLQTDLSRRLLPDLVP